MCLGEAAVTAGVGFATESTTLTDGPRLDPGPSNTQHGTVSPPGDLPRPQHLHNHHALVIPDATSLLFTFLCGLFV